MLVKVDAVDVNPIDTYIRSGLVAMPLPLPFIVGCDLAGIVEAVGPAVKRFKAGDRVWGSNQGLLGRQGTFAEYAAVDEDWLYPTPQGVTSEAAAALALVGITAHLGLVRDAKLKAGEIAVRQRRHRRRRLDRRADGQGAGRQVITTAGSAEKVERCRELGADLADQLQDRRRRRADQGVRPAGRERLVGDVARAELRSGRRHCSPRAAG